MYQILKFKKMMYIGFKEYLKGPQLKLGRRKGGTKNDHVQIQNNKSLKSQFLQMSQGGSGSVGKICTPTS